jgi:beta-glucanase (GH16 family)
MNSQPTKIKRSSRLKRSSFSKLQLVVFVAVFAAIGSYLLISSFAASNPNLSGDLNNDNTVNALDLSRVLTNYGTTNTSGDANSDNTVNALDLSIVLSHYGQSYTSGGNQLAITSPANGATLIGTVAVNFSGVPAGTAFIGISSCGQWVEDGASPWSIDLDTTQCTSNGGHFIIAYAYSSSGVELGTTQINITVNNPTPPSPDPACSDGVNNDGAEDSLVDYPADPGCTSATDTDETNTPTGVPSPITGSGYSLSFQDGFSMIDRQTWSNRVWYDPSPPSGTQYVDTDGVLHLVSRRSDGYPNIQMTTLNAGTGQDQDHVFTQGYFEARMRTTAGNGAWPAFWLFSQRHAENPSWPAINPYCANNSLAAALCYSSELDVIEGQGGEPTTFYGTLHRNSCDCYGVPNSQNLNNGSTTATLPGVWHTYAAKWTSTTVSWYLDNTLVHSTPVYDSTNQPMFIILTMQTGGWVGGTDTSTPDELHTEVDWVRVWQK